MNNQLEKLLPYPYVGSAELLEPLVGLDSQLTRGNNHYSCQEFNQSINGTKNETRQSGMEIFICCFDFSFFPGSCHADVSGFALNWFGSKQKWKKSSNIISKIQGFGSGSGSVLDPCSIGPVDPDPDPYSESGSGSRRAKMTHKCRKNLCFEVLDGLFCELEASSVTWTYFMEA